MKEEKHYEHQRKFFDKEFSLQTTYTLAPWQESYILKIKKYLLNKDYKNSTLLDIASGTGYVAVEMARLGMKVIACDLSHRAIENLKDYKKKFLLKNLKLIECRAEEIPLKSESVDYIVTNAILEHIPNEKKAINEWKRLLKPGGKIFITVPLEFRYIWPFLWLINYLHDKRIGHLRRYSFNSLKRKFKMKVIKHFYTGHLIKVIGVLLSIILRTKKLNEYFEKQDRKKENNIYGANNISVILKNEK